MTLQELLRLPQPRDWFPLPEVLLCLGTEELEDALEATGFTCEVPEGASGLCVTGRCREDGSMLSLVWLSDSAVMASRDDRAAMLSHEAVHVAQDMLAALGEEDPGAEVMAYLVASVMAALLAQMAARWDSDAR